MCEKEKKKGLFTSRKNRVRDLLLVLLPFFVIACVLVCFVVSSAKSMLSNATDTQVNTSSENTIEGMNIHLRDGATDLQKDLFKQLQEAYKGDDSELIAKLTAENFVADFYTWTNKNGSYDVGGVYYCIDRPNIELQGRDTFYKYVSYYINKYGKENLLEVTNISAECHKTDDDYYVNVLDEYFESYYVEVTWEYANHPGFTEKEFATKEYFFVIKSSTGRFEIAECYGE